VAYSDIDFKPAINRLWHVLHNGTLIYPVEYFGQYSIQPISAIERLSGRDFFPRMVRPATDMGTIERVPASHVKS